MIGYPNGLSDNQNCFPIIRGGHTASHPSVDFQRKKEGCLDIAAFPGSSGSPILLFNQGAYLRRGNALVSGGRFKLLGTLWGRPILNIHGQIEIGEIPTAKQAVVKTESMLNLGYYIKSRNRII